MHHRQNQRVIFEHAREYTSRVDTNYLSLANQHGKMELCDRRHPRMRRQ